MTTTRSGVAGRYPNLYIVGAPKTGTTSMYEYLITHPEIYMSPVKEPGYFAPDVVGARKREKLKYPADEAQYLALFEGATEPVIGEASTMYLMSREAPALIKSLVPDAKIVAMVRNPVDLVYSLHSERVSNLGESVEDFEAAIALDDQRRTGASTPDLRHGYGAAYRDNALLGEQVKRWIDTFGPESCHVIVFDDFAQQPDLEFAKTVRFLGVAESYEPRSYQVHNASHRHRRGMVAQLFANPVTRAIRRRLLPVLVGANRTARLTRRVRQSPLMRKRHQRDPLSTDVRRRLEEEFTPDVELLGSLIGRDLRTLWFGEREAH